MADLTAFTSHEAAFEAIVQDAASSQLVGEQDVTVRGQSITVARLVRGMLGNYDSVSGELLDTLQEIEQGQLREEWTYADAAELIIGAHGWGYSSHADDMLSNLLLDEGGLVDAARNYRRQRADESAVAYVEAFLDDLDPELRSNVALYGATFLLGNVGRRFADQ